jgi:hypothetical protein
VILEVLTEVSTLLANALALGVGLYSFGKAVVAHIKNPKDSHVGITAISSTVITVALLRRINMALSRY